jgi:23S rRNA (guanosine2251-2'-O)-methyltransferase
MAQNSLSLCLDNLRSAYNVGSIFRTAAAAGINQIFLCGITPLPLNPKVNKTALGSVQFVSWSHHCDTAKCLAYLKSQRYLIISLEVDPHASSLYQYQFSGQTCLVVGNEKNGLNQNLLALSDRVIMIPQSGAKESLNVSVATAITLYEWHRQQLQLY